MQKGKLIGLNEFRKILGVAHESYQTMGELKRSVIMPALEEVNDRANFVVSLERLNECRRITGFNLAVNPKKQTQSKSPLKVNKKIELLKAELKKYFGSISQQTEEFIFLKYPVEYIYEKMQYTRDHCHKNKLGLYPIAYFISALKNNYQSNDTSPKENIKESKENSLIDKWNHEFKSISSDLNMFKKKLKIVENRKDFGNIIKHTTLMINTLEAKLEKHIAKKAQLIGC